MSTIVEPVFPPCHLDDEITASHLQLEEIHYRDETKKAKYSADNVLDLEVAYADYLTEIESHLSFLQDVKLAHSIANAVDADADAIAKFTRGESQAHEDHRLAVQMSNYDPELEAPPPYTEGIRENSINNEVARRLAALLIPEHDLYCDPEVEAGPSVPYAQRQADAYGKLTRNEFECISCSEVYRFSEITQVECDNNYQYCSSCVKKFIMRGVVDHDLAYVPPRCCGTEVFRALIVGILTEEEMEEFTNAEVEKQTRVKTYCRIPECGRFVAPQHILAGEATCPCCETKTCTMCNGSPHEGDCPEDPGIQAILQLGGGGE